MKNDTHSEDVTCRESREPKTLGVMFFFFPDIVYFAPVLGKTLSNTASTAVNSQGKIAAVACL